MITCHLDRHEIQCPSCYEELETGTYQRIVKEWNPDEPDIGKRDFFKLFDILTGTNYRITRNAENEQTIWNAIHWYVTQPFQFSTELPKVLRIDSKVLRVPRKVGALSAGQNIHMRDAIAKSTYMEESISIAVAIAMQPLYDNAKYDIDRARELEVLVRGIPIYLTHPIGFFYLQTVRSPGRKPTVGSVRILSNLGQSLKRILPKWQKRGGFESLTTYH